jgi:hypothetical protein
MLQQPDREGGQPRDVFRMQKPCPPLRSGCCNFRYVGERTLHDGFRGVHTGGILRIFPPTARNFPNNARVFVSKRSN